MFIVSTKFCGIINVKNKSSANSKETKKLDINYEETDLSVLNNFVKIVKRLDL